MVILGSLEKIPVMLLYIINMNINNIKKSTFLLFHHRTHVRYIPSYKLHIFIWRANIIPFLLGDKKLPKNQKNLSPTVPVTLRSDSFQTALTVIYEPHTLMIQQPPVSKNQTGCQTTQLLPHPSIKLSTCTREETFLYAYSVSSGKISLLVHAQLAVVNIRLSLITIMTICFCFHLGHGNGKYSGKSSS